MIDIVVYGSIAQDLVSYTDQFPRPGETIKGTFETSSGGKGANQAAQAAMLGATVYIIGKKEEVLHKNFKNFWRNKRNPFQLFMVFFPNEK
ncbi:unnamed protein product [Brugia pahangi]|uniref:PfkB domain-containing protein n=1 Tax=Brugia pahangi TaxID=6280 RepID=A0A0N4TCG2_BRUPA|nr:unnamed protein product [Brugia pahangi]